MSSSSAATNHPQPSIFNSYSLKKQEEILSILCLEPYDPLESTSSQNATLAKSDELWKEISSAIGFTPPENLEEGQLSSRVSIYIKNHIDLLTNKRVKLDIRPNTLDNLIRIINASNFLRYAIGFVKALHAEHPYLQTHIEKPKFEKMKASTFSNELDPWLFNLYCRPKSRAFLLMVKKVEAEYYANDLREKQN
ncbi:MAG: hypothetical protein K1060chlam1_00808 [Candidatus Anoxychlamydiales bacterium]|nr:hypothetical protein [Candidatus Anoxychlamydiales bacterium]